MSAWRQIYEAAGWWNEHWGRIKTVAKWIAVSGGILLVGGGLLVQRYGWVGAMAILIGGLCLVSAAAAFVLERVAPRFSAKTVPAGLLETGQDPDPPGPWMLVPGPGTGVVFDRSSDDPLVRVRYTELQHPHFQIASRFPDHANERGEIELDRGHGRPVTWLLE